MEGFRFSLPYQVRVADVNYGGHVGNAAVLNYFQDARIAYLAQLGPYTELDLGEPDCGLILPEAQVRYLQEMFLGDRLEIGVRITELRNSGFEMVYRIERDGVATAEGRTALVAFDYAQRRPRRIPAGLRQAAAQFEQLQG